MNKQDLARLAAPIVACVCITVLVALHDLDKSYLLAVLAWLAPSPTQQLSPAKETP